MCTVHWKILVSTKYVHFSTIFHKKTNKKQQQKKKKKKKKKNNISVHLLIIVDTSTDYPLTVCYQN